MQPLRWAGITICAALAAVSLVYAVIYLTESSAGPFGSNLAFAGLFGVSAVLLWRRPGWRRTGIAFGLLILGVFVLYIVLVELRKHGYSADIRRRPLHRTASGNLLRGHSETLAQPRVTPSDRSCCSGFRGIACLRRAP